MKLSKNIHPKGFTLIEILIVMAIIATLSAIAFPIVNSIRESAKRTESSLRMREFESAVSKYFSDHKNLPYAGDEYPEDDTVLTGEDLASVLNLLLNIEPNKNSKNTRYLIMPDAVGGKNGIVYDADTGAAVSMADSWGKNFVIALDYDFDSSIEDPAESDGTIEGKRVILHSKGQDYEKSDYLYSWK